MTTLNEHNIFQSYIGRKVYEENFKKVFKQNRLSRYIAYCSDFKGDFGITDSLYERWELGGIDFRVIVTLSEGVVEIGAIDKYREGQHGHGRPLVHVLKPTQQEIRVARRILDYVTE